MTDCLFCKIVSGDIPADIVYRDDIMTVFKDISPKARVHLLAVPNHHVESLNDLTEEDAHWVAHITRMLPVIARDNGLTEGFRTVVNTGAGGGQEVYHLHYHILGDVRDANWRGF